MRVRWRAEVAERRGLLIVESAPVPTVRLERRRRRRGGATESVDVVLDVRERGAVWSLAEDVRGWVGVASKSSMSMAVDVGLLELATW